MLHFISYVSIVIGFIMLIIDFKLAMNLITCIEKKQRNVN